MASSPETSKELPFIFPAGKNMKPEEFFALRYKQLDLNDDKDETLSQILTKICLNETPVEHTLKHIINSDPEVIVRSILEDVLQHIRTKNVFEIGYYEALSLSYDKDVQAAFNRSFLLKYVDLRKLTNVEQTTCFLINLTNLLWIHALFSFSEEFHDGLLYKNWCLRHIHFNMVGYRVGSLNFVSLYDLHSTLLNYPSILQTNSLKSLSFSEDARLHSVICQPYCFSPKITVINPDNLNQSLTDLQNEYLKSYIVVDSYIDLMIPVPLVMQMERSVYSQQIESESGINADGIPEKLALLVEVLKDRGFPYYELLSKDVYMMADTQYKIKFEYNVFDIENVSQMSKVIWKCCRFHKSLYNCLQHHASLVRSTLMDDHLCIDSFCRCADKSAICTNNVLYKMSQTYNPMLNEYIFEIDFENKGLRCLYAAVSFAVGIKRKKQKLNLNRNADDEFLLMLQIIESHYLFVPTSIICDKIKVCVKIFLIANEVYEKWPKWYSLFIGNPSEILSFIVDHNNCTLAEEWISVTYAMQPGFTFKLEAFSKYISSLSDLEDNAHLKKALTSISDLSISDICDYVVKNFFSPKRLINLITTVIDSNYFNDTERKKLYALLVGLKMILYIPSCEQTYYYDIASSPMLIIEQLILNKKISTLKTLLKQGADFVDDLPEEIQQLELISRNEIDILLRDYAGKALHFRKKPSPSDCLNAALLHAEIFKEGQFCPPDKVPSNQMWIPNNYVSKCMCCKETEFTVFVRRHHCRRCGRVVCDACSTKRMKVATYKGLVRVCEQCYEFESQYENMDDSTSEISAMTDDDTKKLQWKLSPDSEVNNSVRQQASFDSAPDIELCLSILELHSEHIAVPRLLFANAESLIKILRQRLICPANFDYSEVSHIIKSLFLAAKLYYTHLGETQGTRRCEELDSEVDLLNQLSRIKLFPIDTSKPLRDIQELKKVRDTVLERQQWTLALEISTKIGMECNSIWYLWGKELLKSGDYAAAREKISKSNIKRNPMMLKDVLEILYANAERETPRSLVDLFKIGSSKQVPTLPDKIMDECLHYLKNYGTPQQQFDFYVKYDRLSDVVALTAEKKIPPKQFTEKVFSPYMKLNDYTSVLKLMKNHDQSLKQWEDYINEISIFCKKNDLSKELYEIQLWSKDYYRAAISCSLFYTKGATCYAQLAKREEHILNAIAHLKSYLEQCQGEKRDNISKQLACFNMQKNFAQVISQNLTTANVKFIRIPTLFGYENDKCLVIGLLFDALSEFKIAFDHTENLISELDLNAKRIYIKLTENFIEKNVEPAVLKNLLDHLQKSPTERQEIIDSVASTVIKKGIEPDMFFGFIKNATLKIEMCIEANRLKTAYTLAIRINSLELLEKILEKCEQQNLDSLVNICRRKVASMKKSS